MKKYICILASAALFAACEQKTETVAPAASPTEKTENNTTIVNPSPAGGTHTDTHSSTNTTNTIAVPSTPASTPMSGTSMESTTTTTTATATPSGQ